MLFLLLLQGVPDVVSAAEPLRDYHPLLYLIFVMMVAAILYLLRLSHQKDQELKELNGYIRENDKANLTTIAELTRVVDKLADNTEKQSDEIRREIDLSVEKILAHLTSLVERLRNTST